MEILAAYLVVGIIACAVAACRGDKSDRRGELLLSMLIEPVWPVIFLWPLGLAVVLVERLFPKVGGSASPAGVDPLGQVGVVVSDLRPLGRIQIGAAQFDARSDGRLIPAGTSVRIVSRSMAEFLVEVEPPYATQVKTVPLRV